MLLYVLSVCVWGGGPKATGHSGTLIGLVLHVVKGYEQTHLDLTWLGPVSRKPMCIPLVYENATISCFDGTCAHGPIGVVAYSSAHEPAICMKQLIIVTD